MFAFDSRPINRRILSSSAHSAALISLVNRRDILISRVYFISVDLSTRDSYQRGNRQAFVAFLFNRYLFLTISFLFLNYRGVLDYSSDIRNFLSYPFQPAGLHS